MTSRNTDKNCLSGKAIFSDCGKHRLELRRTISKKGPTVVFIGVNPSTADSTQDDATMRKLKGFCVRHGWAKFIMLNAISYIATDIKELRQDKPFSFFVHADQLKCMNRAMVEADLIVPCWGSRTKLPQQLRPALDWAKIIVESYEAPKVCFGKTKYGDPRHPLMLPYDTELEDF